MLKTIFIRDLRSYMSGFDRDRITSGGKVSGPWRYRWYGRDLLGKE